MSKDIKMEKKPLDINKLNEKYKKLKRINKENTNKINNLCINISNLFNNCNILLKKSIEENNEYDKKIKILNDCLDFIINDFYYKDENNNLCIKFYNENERETDSTLNYDEDDDDENENDDDNNSNSDIDSDYDSDSNSN